MATPISNQFGGFYNIESCPLEAQLLIGRTVVIPARKLDRSAPVEEGAIPRHGITQACGPAWVGSARIVADEIRSTHRHTLPHFPSLPVPSTNHIMAFIALNNDTVATDLCANRLGQAWFLLPIE